MYNLIRTTIVSILLILFTSLGYSQVKIMAKDGEMFDMRELGAIVLLKDNKIKVEFVMPDHARHADYRDVDIQKDDEIIFFNGKKISTTIELEKNYNDLSVGEEVNLGTKRKDKLMIVSFKKADPESFPKRQMMKIKVDEDDPSGSAQEVEINGKKYKAKNGKVVIDGEEISVKDLMHKKGHKSKMKVEQNKN